MPSRRTVLADIEALGLDPKKPHVVCKNGRLFDPKKISTPVNKADPIVKETVITHEEPVKLDQLPVVENLTTESQSTVDESSSQQPLVVESNIVETVKPSSKFKKKKLTS